MSADLEDKVILVTGAGSGIGEACAKRIAAGGARVAVVARRRLPHERELGVGGPVIGVVRLVDEDPDILVAPLHLLLGANEAGRHAPPAARRMARSIFG